MSDGGMCPCGCGQSKRYHREAHALACAKFDGTAGECACLECSERRAKSVDTISGARLRETRSNLLDFATDEQLRREWDRRNLSHGPAVWSDEALRDEGNRRHVGFWYGPSAAAVLDEWKRRAEAAEATIETQRCRHHTPIVRCTACRSDNAIAESFERGPGIAAMSPRDDGHYVDPWDFLEDE